MLAGRNPKHDVILDGSRVNYTTFGVGITINDMETGELRSTCKQDLADTARVADALDNVDVYTHAVTAGLSVPLAAVDLHEAEAFLNNTTKHCQHVDLTCGVNAQKYIDMAALVVGGIDKLRERPIISALICPQSPLALHDICCDIIMTFARNGIPCNVLSMAMSGGTAPVSMAGTLVVHNSEVLAGIVLSQAAQKGAPIMYGSSTTTFDLMHATAPVGSPELGMCSAGVAYLAQYYKLPSFVAGT
jgi:trimethylamine--corrinoid protein Co-methyltransferase